MNNNALTIQNLTVTYQNDPVLWSVNCTIPSGVLLAIVGPNGAGKTTFIKAILGLIKPLAGVVRVFGASYNHKDQTVAYIAQRATIDWDFPVTVFDVVLMGRYGRLGWFARPDAQDKADACAALQKVGMLEYKDRPIGHLSGGQQQRVFLARALVQDAQLYLLDEPFAGIDAAAEKTIVTVLKELRDAGKTIIVVHHDLHTLQEYFDWVLLLNRSCIACGPLHNVLTVENIEKTYGNHQSFAFSVCAQR